MLLEDLIQRLKSHPNIAVNENVDENFRKVMFYVTIDDDDPIAYYIEWWSNVCYFTHNGIKVVFSNMEITNTWPEVDMNRMKLQLLDDRGQVVGLLDLE